MEFQFYIVALIGTKRHVPEKRTEFQFYIVALIEDVHTNTNG